MVIQPFLHTDLLSLSALQPTDWPDISPHFRWYVEDSFCHPIKVVVKNQIAAVGAAIIHGDTAWLGHIIVHEAYRRQGIGGEVTQHLVTSARLHGCETIRLIATELGAPVYEKIGFDTETQYLFYKDVQLASSPERHLVLSAYTDADRDAVAEMDFLSVGENRMIHLEPHLKRGVLAQGKHRMEGFYLPTAGEGLIIADTASAGLALLQYHLGSHNKVMFPKENNAATGFLAHHGYRSPNTVKRMVLGKLKATNLANIYNRIGGNLG